MTIGDWLRRHGLEQYEPAFRAHKVDADILVDLTDADLRTIGVESLGDRKRLLRAIALSAGHLSASSGGPELTSFGTAERRQLTVMFVDLVGSTELSRRLDPEVLGALLNRFHTVVARDVERRQGYVHQFMGDGALIFFGWPQALEDAAERAVDAGLSVAESVAALRTPLGDSLACRIGIATGLVVIGDLSRGGARGASDIAGETPNLAARLQTLAAPGTVVVSDTTRMLLGDRYEFLEVEAATLKGYDHPVKSFQVVARTRAESRFDARRAAAIPLIGRTAELAILEGAWKGARSGHSEIVVVTGEAGIGKSRLVHAFVERLRGEEMLALRYQCSPDHMNSSYYPIKVEIERAAGIAADDPVGKKLDKLEALLAVALPDPGEDVAVFADLLGIGNDGRFPVVERSPAERRAMMFAAFKRQLDGLAALTPVLILVEDTHWLDPTTFELFQHVSEHGADKPVMFVMTSRPEIQFPWPPRDNLSYLDLTRLAEADTRALVDEVAGDTPLPEDLRAEIAARTDGVPLFIEELTRTMLEARERDGPFSGVTLQPTDEHIIPLTLQDSLMARLDRLGRAKWVAQVGACIGREFDHALIAAIVEHDDLNGAIDRLVASGLITSRPGTAGDRYAFRHALVQDAAYQSLLIEERRMIHRQVAEALEARFPHVAGQQPELLAHHYATAGVERKAIEYGQKAAALALDRSAYTEALRILDQTLELIGNVQPAPTDTAAAERKLRDLLACRILRGQALTVLKGYGALDVEQEYLAVRSLANRVGELQPLYQAALGLWRVYAQRGQIAAARSHADEMLRLAPAGAPPAMVLTGHLAVGIFQLAGGELASGLSHLDEAIAIYRKEVDPKQAIRLGQAPGLTAMIWRTLGAVLAGTHRMADEMAEQTLAEAAALEHPMTQSYVVLYAAAIAMLRGAEESVRERSRLLSQLHRAYGFAFLDGIPGIFEGYVLARHDGDANGVRLMKDCIEARYRSGSNLLRPMYLGMLAEASLSLGDIGAAQRAIDDALSHADLSGEVWYVPELHRKEAQLALAASPADPTVAERALKAAAQVARQQGAGGLELRALRDLQTLWDSGAETEVGGRAEYRRRLSALARSVPEKAPLTESPWREPHGARLTD